MHALSKAMGSVPGPLENSGGDGRAEQCSACGGYITWWQEAARGGYITGQEADLYLGSQGDPAFFCSVIAEPALLGRPSFCSVWEGCAVPGLVCLCNL